MTILFDLFVKSVLVLGAAFAANLAWRRASASERHLIWSLAFGTLLLLPLTHLVTPRWTLHPPAVQAVFTNAKLIPAVPAIAPSALPTVSGASLAWSDVLFAAWLVGVFSVLAFRGVGQLRLWRLHRRSQPLNDPRLAPGISWRHSPECAVPLTWGVWRPVVMLPSAALAWPEQNRNTALRHELAHIERRDWLTRLVAHCLCAVYWPNPLVWLAARSLRLAQEQACDDTVLRSGAPADEYAALLCNVARFAGQCAVAMAQPSTLERRVRAIVDDRCNRGPLNRWTVLAGVLLVAGVVACSTTTQVAKEERKTQVTMEAKIIEAPAGKFKATPTVKELLAAKDIDVLSAPKVTTFSGQQATVQVGRDVAVGTDKKTIIMEGVTVELLPKVRTDGKICVTAKLLVCRQMPGTKEPLSAASFHTSELESTVIARPGETILLGGVQSEDRVLYMALTSSIVEKPGVADKASKIIIPQVSFQDASLNEVVGFLVEKSRELDPDKQGVNVILQDAPRGQPATITLNLRNVPLLQAVKYIAAIVGMKVVVEPNSLRLVPQ